MGRAGMMCTTMLFGLPLSTSMTVTTCGSRWFDKMPPMRAQGQFVFGFQPNTSQLKYRPTGINNPKGATPMSKYGDDYICSCEMNMVSCKNDYHADHCELWQEPSFKDGTDEWDGDLGCLVLARSPWHNPEDYVWDGDEPVVRKTTALERFIETVEEAVAEIPDLEQEALDALGDKTAEK